MASNVTLLAVRTEVRQRTHYENSQFVIDTELNGYINRSAKELYDLLVSSFEAYNASTADSTIASGNTFALPADFYKLLGVDLVVTLPDQLQTLPRTQFSDRNTSQIGYDLRGSNVVILPYTGAAGRTYRLYYVPVLATLAGDNDPLDGVYGWEEYVIVDAAIKVLAKANRDPSAFMGQKQSLLERVRAMAHNRDAGQPPHVTDARSLAGQGALIGGRWLYDLW